MNSTKIQLRLVELFAAITLAAGTQVSLHAQVSGGGESAEVAVAREVRQAAPDYDNWTPEIFKNRLSDHTANFMLGRVTTQLPYDVLIPRSYFTRYGEQARPVFVRSLLSAEEATNNLGGPADAIIKGLLQTRYNLTPAQVNRLNLTTPITVTRADGSQVNVLPSEVFTYLIGSAMNGDTGTQVNIDIPSAIMRSIVANNRRLITEPWGNIAPRFALHDEAAHIFGYVIGKRYGTRVGTISTNIDQLPREQACRVLPSLEASIFNPLPDRPVNVSYIGGYIRAAWIDCAN